MTGTLILTFLFGVLAGQLLSLGIMWLASRVVDREAAARWSGR